MGYRAICEEREKCPNIFVWNGYNKQMSWNKTMNWDSQDRVFQRGHLSSYFAERGIDTGCRRY